MTMKSTLMSFTAALLLGATAHANTTETVRYQDLNLTNQADIVRLQARIANAADNVCFTLQDRDLFRMREYDRCRAAAIADAWTQVRLHTASAVTVARR